MAGVRVLRQLLTPPRSRRKPAPQSQHAAAAPWPRPSFSSFYACPCCRWIAPLLDDLVGRLITRFISRAPPVTSLSPLQQAFSMASACSSGVGILHAALLALRGRDDRARWSRRGGLVGHGVSHCLGTPRPRRTATHRRGLAVLL
jgi:hypothetical protein